VFVVPSTVRAGSEDAGGFVVPSTVRAGSEDAGGVPLVTGGVTLPLATAPDPVLVGGASPADAELTPVDVGSLAEAEAVADAVIVAEAAGAEVAVAETEATSLADALVAVPAAALIVADTGAVVVMAAPALDKVADAAGGARRVVWIETDRVVLADPKSLTKAIAGALGIAMETSEGARPAFKSSKADASNEAAAAAAMSAGLSCLVVLLKTRAVSFMVVAGSRFS